MAVVLCTAALLTLTIVPGARGQMIPTPDASPTAATADEFVKLPPFTATAERDVGYRGGSTLAGTRLNTDLRDVGSAISVATEEFLRDTGAKNSAQLLLYTTNTEVAGIRGNFLGAGVGAQISAANLRMTPQQDTRVRGLTAADNTRDYFLTDVPWDVYIVDRIDMQRGPNSILFGMGSPAGIINASIKAAGFKNAGRVEVRTDSDGTVRGSLDYNQVLLKDELAVRIDALDDHEVYRQKPAYNRDVREFAALRYDPRWLNRGSAHTSLKFNFEQGSIHANNPDPTPPIDAITPWFSGLNKMTYDDRYTGAYTVAQVNAHPGTGAGVRSIGLRDAVGNGVVSPNWSPWVTAFGRIYDDAVFIYGRPDSGTAGGNDFPVAITGSGNSLMAPGQSIGDSRYLGASMAGIATYDVYAATAGLPNANLGVYKTKSLTDPSIFDFYNRLLGGPNDNQSQRWETFTGDFSQTFRNNRFGYDLAVNQERQRQTQEFMFQGFANAVTIDINRTLPDGSPNPNVGRPAVASDSGYNAQTENERHAVHLTAFAEINFADFLDRSNSLGRILGRHVFTGFYSQESHSVFSTQWTRFATDDVYGARIQTPGVTSPNRIVATISYLGPSLANAATAAGAHIGNLTATQSPATTGNFRVFNSTYSNSALDPNGPWTDPATGQVLTNKDNLDNYPGWETEALTVWNADQGQRNRLYTGASRTKVSDEAEAVVWQGFLFDGNLVTTAGIRRDHADFFNAGNVPANADGTAAPFDPNWVLPVNPTHVVTGTTKSWSFVLHSPKSLNDRLPWGTGLSVFFNRSSNFNPQPDRIGIFGEPLPAPEGRTTDYGVALSTLNDKLILKVNWYRTTVRHQSLAGGVPPGFYMVGDSEAWGYMFAERALHHYGAFAQDYLPAPGQTQAEATAEQNQAVSAFLANLQPDSFWTTWQITGGTSAASTAANTWQTSMQAQQPSNLAITSDTLSRGVEFELTAQPTKNWNLTINASRVAATQLNLARDVSDWIEARHAFFQGPAGLLREWSNGYNPSENLRNKFDRETYASYQLIKLQEGGDIPELRPWRVNLVTNYRFTQGLLRGWSVGGALRWQSAVVVGYPVVNGTFDLAHPFLGPDVGDGDLWFAYERKVMRNIQWRVQMNIGSMLVSKRTIPVSVEPDGSAGQVRMVESPAWTLTNSFSF